MDLTFEQVMDLLRKRGITPRIFDELSVKTVRDLWTEYERREVRFLLQTDRKIIRFARSAHVLAVSPEYKFVQVERRHWRKGVLVPSKGEKPYTYSETLLWSSPAEPEKPSEDARVAAVRGALEEGKVVIDPADLIAYNSCRLSEPYESSVYAGLHTRTLVEGFRTDPAKLGLTKELTTWIDSTEEEAPESDIKRMPISGAEYTELMLVE